MCDARELGMRMYVVYMRSEASGLEPHPLSSPTDGKTAVPAD